MEDVCLPKTYIKSKLSSHLPNNSVSRLQYREVRESFSIVYCVFSVIVELTIPSPPVGLFGCF